MELPKLFQVIGASGAIFLTSFGTFAQIENPPSVKGRWGVSAGLTMDRYKTDVSVYRGNKTMGLLPMLTYTHGKNQFELGPQFSLLKSGHMDIHRYFGVNLNYKRYFNGFGNRFVPYLYSGIGFSTTSSNTVQDNGSGVITSRYPYNYKQVGVNLSIGYGLEWQIGKGFYIGSSVSFNPGIYSVRKSDFMSDIDWINKSSGTFGRLDFNVNMQLGYRFGK
ncbi:MAG: hypothetical protein K0S23_1189 [Fluviicola sp.]|jgi:hypothetical protein|uniref:hypothetical protein n=1 Tax=Fluviicola sp. TaxID=1917219 RepID=UPI002613DDEF|nr:hypothetical protein [Fluviicola sp.]MDF3026882.1 hypothetical protein [Fluviicola sp.]